MTQPTTTLPPTNTTTDYAPPIWGSPAGPPPTAPPAKRKIGRYVAGGVALLFIIGMLAGDGDKKDTASSDGVVTTPTTASTPAATTRSTTNAAAAASLSVSSWTSRYGSDDAATLGSDLTALSADAGAMDLSGMSSSCRTFQRNLATAKSHLPTPDAQLTSALTTAYGYFSQATAACISGIANVDPDELGEMATYLSLGSASINTATARIKALS